MYHSDEERLESEIKIKKPITDRNVSIAEAYVYTQKPADFIEYCNDGLGFCLSYPKRWGTVILKKYNVFCEQEQYYDVVGEFSHAGIFIEIPFITTSKKDTCIHKGNDFHYGDPFRSFSDASKILRVGNTNEEVGLWFRNERTSFFTYTSEMSLTAPTSHDLYSRIGFRISMSDEETTKQDIEDFIAMAHSFRLEEISGEVAEQADDNTDPCTALPYTRAIGDTQNPTAEKYATLPKIGPLFTAADCGDRRLASFYGDLTSTVDDLRIVLHESPSPALRSTFEKIGFSPREGTDNTQWLLKASATYSQLLQLKPFAAEFAYDDCTQCG